jgi:predicted Zn-dependent protease
MRPVKVRHAAVGLARASLAALILGACAHAEPPAPLHSPSAATASSPPRRFGSAFSYEWFVRAEVESSRGNQAAAVEAYRTAMADADEDPYLFARLALSLDLAGDEKNAMKALHEGLAIDPDSEADWLASGDIARRHHALDEALHAYERAQAAAPASARGPLALAELLQELGQAGRAVAVLERFAARSPVGSPIALRARLALALARSDGAALAETARAFSDQVGGDAALMRGTARELAQRGHPALAARILSQLPITDDDVRLRLELGLLLADDARVELLLTTTAPSLLGGPLEVAEAYLRIGRPEHALDMLAEQDAAADVDPHRRALLRGEALLALGHPEQAALLLAAIPPASSYRERAMRALAQALEAAGMPTLAREVEHDRAR